MGCKVCLNELCNGGCCDVSYDTLQDIAYNLRLRIAEMGNNYEKRLKEGQSCSPADFDFKAESIERTKLSKSAELIIEHKHLTQLLFVINKEIKNLYNDVDSCLKTKTLCKIKDKALSILGFNCLGECRKDIKIDSTAEQSWIEDNPYCVSREKWEELLYRVCNDLQVSITVVKQRCDLVYDIVREYRDCSIDYNLTKTEKDCRIVYNVLRNDIDCNISYDIFRSLLDCGITYDTIRASLVCGIEFDIDRENNCPMIVTINDTYSLCNDDFDGERLRNIIYQFSIGN